MTDRSIEILVTGGAGQLGQALRMASWPDSVRLITPGRDTLDITDPDSIASALEEGRFAAIINCAAFTSVDRAESETQATFAVNALGPALLAAAARDRDIPLVHISTDYIFDGALGRPYHENDAPNPVNAYGASKLEGEQAVLAAAGRHVIIRTAWLVSPFGANFVRTIMRLCDAERRLDVVADHVGNPTSAADMAQALATITLRLIDDPDCPTGIFNFVNNGSASRYSLAKAVIDARQGRRPELTAITAADFSLAAIRPADTRLDCTKISAAFGLCARPWTEAVSEVVRLIEEQQEVR